MRHSPSLLLFASLLAVAGCDAKGLLAPPDGFANAAATRSCGPADGPAVTIYLAPVPIATLEPATPYIQLNLWMPAGALVGSWSVSPSSAAGFASRFNSASELNESVTSGNVTVTAVGKDSTITGNVDLKFQESGQVHGGFTAHWIPRTMLCG